MESPVLSSAQMQAAERAAFARGVTVEALMDQAGAGVARAVRQFFPKPATCIVFAGKGHNGGDALVAGDRHDRPRTRPSRGEDGNGPADRITAAGYKFSAMAENVAMGQRTPAEVIASWMLSTAGHKENMLNSTYTEIGIGIAADANGQRYWTQVFATPLSK